MKKKVKSFYNLKNYQVYRIIFGGLILFWGIIGFVIYYIIKTVSNS
ncbi:hypothetical protein GCM10019993_23950 [Enterococcus pseudoavium]